MRVLVGLAFVFFCFYKGFASADDATTTNAAANVEIMATTNTAVNADTTPPGNQGYVYGTPPKADETATTDTTTVSPNPLKALWDFIESIDTWERQNLW